jgi:hypothetical protein
MTEAFVPDEMTPIAPAPLYTALRAAAPVAIGGDLPRASAILLLAQIAEETGWRSCHCWNLGNIKHLAGDGHNFTQFDCTEIIGGKEVKILAGQAGSSFRAYASLADGCVDYLALLHRSFAGAWTFVEGGDPHGFVKALAAEHYFTASEDLYERSVTALDVQLAKEIPDDPAPYVPLDVAAIIRIGQPTPPSDLPPADA